MTDNGWAKATPMSEYPVQGRYGQGVINVRLPKEASEVVAAAIGDEKMEIYITTLKGAAKRVTLDKKIIGSRSVKPREVVKFVNNDRAAGALSPRKRLEMTKPENT
jgi:DNA gyrase subunit A